MVFDCAIPPDRLPRRQRARFDEIAELVAAAGEPWRTFFDPPQLAASLRAAGFMEVDDVHADALNISYFSSRATGFASRVSPAWRTSSVSASDQGGKTTHWAAAGTVT